MFPNHQLSSTFSLDRQTRLRNTATKRRLVRRNKVPPTERTVASILTVVWPDEADCAMSEQRAHYVT